MGRDPRHDVLFEPVQIGPKTMRNRFFQAAHCLGAGSDRPGFQSHFRAMKAEGGWAAVSTEYCAIGPESDDTHRVSARIWDEGDVRNLALTCEMVHAHDSLAAIELWHGGPTAPRQESRVPALGPSQAVHAFGFGSSCKEMDRDDIRRVQAQFVDAARRARAAGFDIITVHITGGGSIPHQFLLPIWNRRTDAYGGSFQNRARFSREVLEAVREAVGEECAIAARFGVDTLPEPWGWGDRGVRSEGEGLRFIEHCDDLVDLWDINIAASEWGEDAGPSRTHAQNFQRPYVETVKQHTDKPVMNVGRFTDVDAMAAMVRDGQLDIVGAARPSIADPFIPVKIEEGRIDEIRECIGCNVCISRWEIGGPPLICTQNATSGEEYRRGWHPERFEPAREQARDVLVVGAGPAGMECAIVLAKRGMRRVHLVDAEAEIGGIMRWIPQLPGLGEWARLVNYRRIQIDKLRNLTFVPETRLDAAAVREYGAEIVVLATGAEWAGDGENGFTHRPIPGADAGLPHVLTPEQVMVEGKRPPGDRVVVYDCEGYFMGVGMAELLRGEGREVTLVTPLETLAPYTEYTLEGPRLNRSLRRQGIEIVVGHSLAEIDPDGTTLSEVWEGDARRIDCEATVLVTQRNSRSALHRELKADPAALAEAGIEAVHAIGDCVAPALIAEAVFSGHRLGREIDSEDPTVALPFIRERRLLGAAESDYALPGP
ncbi:MAG: FAD-dependent oxidoreductase [Actinobacteria bacterium]|nr:FAD-dependent oxidoreductase [Actinomycetota bacterium]